MTTKYMFKFPYKMYSNSDWEKYQIEKQKHFEDSTVPKPDIPDYAIGYHMVAYDQIMGFSSSFTTGRDILEVQTDNGDLSTVNIKGGQEYGCAWTLQELCHNYDKFLENIEKEKEKDYLEQIEKQSIMVKEVLEKNLSEIKNRYEQEGLSVADLGSHL